MDNLGQRWIEFRIIGRLGLPAPAGVIVGECFSDWCGDYPKDALSDPTGPTEGGNRGPWRQLGRAGLELSFGVPGACGPLPHLPDSVRVECPASEICRDFRAR